MACLSSMVGCGPTRFTDSNVLAIVHPAIRRMVRHCDGLPHRSIVHTYTYMVKFCSHRCSVNPVLDLPIYLYSSTTVVLGARPKSTQCNSLRDSKPGHWKAGGLLSLCRRCTKRTWKTKRKSQKISKRHKDTGVVTAVDKYLLVGVLVRKV